MFPSLSLQKICLISTFTLWCDSVIQETWSLVRRNVDLRILGVELTCQDVTTRQYSRNVLSPYLDTGCECIPNHSILNNIVLVYATHSTPILSVFAFIPPLWPLSSWSHALIKECYVAGNSRLSWSISVIFSCSWELSLVRSFSLKTICRLSKAVTSIQSR